MYERFTDRSRKVMQLANEEAQRFQHEYIGTEHILLGLLKEGSGVAANVLRNLGVDRDRIRIEVETILRSERDRVDKGDLPRPPWAKKVIEYAMEEGRHLNHNYVGTEHLLLGLLREPEGVAARVLMNLGLKLGDVREEVLNLLGHGIARVEARAPKPAELPSEMTARVRRVLEVAQEEAERLNVGFVGTEHLLLGLVRDQACVAVQILRLAGGTQDLIRAEVERVVGADPTKGSPPLKGAVPYSEAFNRVLTLAEQEARDGEHLGTEHLLFALLSVPEGQAAPVLGRFGITIGKAREAYRRWLSRGISPSRRLFPRESDTAFEDRVADGTEVLSPAHSRRAARVMRYANQESQRFNHEYVDTEHLLLGLVQEGKSVAVNVLKNLGIDPRKIRLEVEKRMQSGPDILAIGRLPQTPRTKWVREYATEEARLAGHPVIGTEHLLLGLLSVSEGKAAEILGGLGVTIDAVRAGIRDVLPDPRIAEDQFLGDAPLGDEPQDDFPAS
ncbi:Clp protease N-terminal domain-containing protein [Planctomyces sp. SH-PL14]|uniref:Clp protease N-terminal domain-containing protein n=1 Tax=Planctomyces sp. SH-PL14 TaxID=1632864 RepID=UPI00078B3D8F|nr:Clp protease N-terminal domain-containing protein [Planctomyces sp. SH-PL14]AMV17522.1 ATP-dependent Clp protease ATP-binding subunit ClpC1 [Planctomyces sp. SH-PL14]